MKSALVLVVVCLTLVAMQSEEVTPAHSKQCQGQNPDPCQDQHKPIVQKKQPHPPLAHKDTKWTNKKCKRAGCAKELCVPIYVDPITPCIWKPEYKCFMNAKCGMHRNGKCGWFYTKKLKTCIKNAKKPATQP